jgi:hypothetical protein
MSEKAISEMKLTAVTGKSFGSNCPVGSRSWTLFSDQLHISENAPYPSKLNLTATPRGDCCQKY